MALLPSSAQSFERCIGVSSEALCPILEDWVQRQAVPLCVIIAKTEKMAEQWASDLALFHLHARGASENNEIHHFPEFNESSDEGSALFESGSDRIAVLNSIRKEAGEKKRIVVSTLTALSQPVPDPVAMAARQIELSEGIEYEFAKLVADLEKLDYDHEGLCEAPGQFARRGGLIDVYPVTEDKPFRIDFFGDEIESIKTLDPVTQRSGESVSSISIAASPRLELVESEAGILEYLPKAISWGLLEPEELLERLDSNLESDRSRSEGLFWRNLQIARTSSGDHWTTFSDLDLSTEEGAGTTRVYEAESLEFYRSYPDESLLADERLADEQSARLRFLEQIRDWEKKGERIIFILPNASDERRIKEISAGSELLKGLNPLFWKGDVNEGFRIHFRENLDFLSWPILKGSKGAVFVTETELFGRRRNRKVLGRKKALVAQSQVDQLLDFAELVDGEFVVHLQHGIAVYRGISKVDIGGQLREVLTLEFEDEILLHVPLQESHLVSRYVGITKTRPRLGKLGSNRWSKRVKLRNERPWTWRLNCCKFKPSGT